MDYMLLVFADPAGLEALNPSQANEAMVAYGAYTEALTKAKVLRGSNRLQPA